MPLNVDHVPRFSATEAERLASELYGVASTARELPSERDQNFHLSDTAGGVFVLKIAAADERRETLDAQNQAMEHVGTHGDAVLCPRVRSTLSGEQIGTAHNQEGGRSGGGSEHFVRLVTWIPGITLAEAQPHSSDLLRSLGEFLGRLDRAFRDFTHPATRRTFYWDLRQTSDTIGNCIEHIARPEQREIVEGYLDRFEHHVVPLLPQLRTSVIHNDANDHNVVVSRDGSSVIGIIDFGDMVESCTVFNLAVGAAYAILDKPDPIEAATHVVAGYHDVLPLDDVEIELLYDLVSMRLCLSVSISAYQHAQNPDNDYLRISEQSAWGTLDRLAQVDPSRAFDTFSRACKTQR